MIFFMLFFLVFFTGLPLSSMIKKTVSWSDLSARDEITEGCVGDDEAVAYKKKNFIFLTKENVAKGRSDFPMLSLFSTHFFLSSFCNNLYAIAPQEFSSHDEVLDWGISESRGLFALFCSKYLHDGNFLTQEESLEAVRLIEGYSSVLEKFKTHYFFYSKSHDYLATIMQRDYLFFEAELSLFSERLARLHQKIICKEPIARQDFGLSLLNAYLLDTKELMFGFMRSEFKLIAEQYPQLDRVALYGWGLAFVMVNYFDLLSTRHYEEQTQGYDLLSFVDSFLQHKINYDCHDDHAGTSLTEYAAHYEGAQLRAHADMHSEKKIFSLENVFAQLQPLLRYRYILDACFRLDSPYSQISAQTESAQLCQNYKELMINTYAFLDRWLSKDFTDNNSFLHIRNLMGRLRLLLDNDITLLKALLHKQSDQ